MHKFLRAVGFSQYTEKKQVQKLIRDIIIHADERSYTTVGKKTHGLQNLTGISPKISE